MASESNTTKPDLIVEGGVDERSIKTRIRQRSSFPVDSKDFYPPQLAEQDFIKNIMKKVGRARVQEIPKPLNDLTLTSELVTINGRNMVRINISFIQDNDKNYNATRVWIKGYMTDNALADTDTTLGIVDTLPYTLIGTGQYSPFQIVLEKTDEEVIIGVEAVNPDGVGSGTASMPTSTITLDGV